MTTAPLAQKFARQLPVDGGPPTEVVLIESPEIGTHRRVGEATLPCIRLQRDLWASTAPTSSSAPKPASRLASVPDWKQLGERFFHGFGDFGPAIGEPFSPISTGCTCAP